VPRTCMRSSPWALNTVGWSVFYLKPSPGVVDGLAAAEWQYARQDSTCAPEATDLQTVRAWTVQIFGRALIRADMSSDLFALHCLAACTVC
jgi:hypothetical protein